MQLNNTTTGHIIRIDDFTVETGRCVYSEYEKIIFKEEVIEKETVITEVKQFTKNFQKTVILNIDWTQSPDADISMKENIEKIAYLKLSENFDGFILSEDIQNWLYEDKLFCITILNSFVLKEIQPLDKDGTLSPIGQIIENEKTKNFGFYSKNDGDSVMTLYASTIAPEDTPIIAPYINQTIWIEKKIN